MSISPQQIHKARENHYFGCWDGWVWWVTDGRKLPLLWDSFATATDWWWEAKDVQRISFGSAFDLVCASSWSYALRAFDLLVLFFVAMIDDDARVVLGTFLSQTWIFLTLRLRRQPGAWQTHSNQDGAKGRQAGNSVTNHFDRPKTTILCPKPFTITRFLSIQIIWTTWLSSKTARKLLILQHWMIELDVSFYLFLFLML